MLPQPLKRVVFYAPGVERQEKHTDLYKWHESYDTTPPTKKTENGILQEVPCFWLKDQTWLRGVMIKCVDFVCVCRQFV